MASRAAIAHLRRAGWVVAVLAAGSVFAQGPLGAIRWPVPGRPAVTTPAGRLEVGMAGEGTINLDAGGTRIGLDIRWEGERAGVRRGTGTLPDALSPGVYDLVASVAGGEERQSGAVHVLAEIPVAYTIALIRGATGPAAGAGLAEGLGERLKEAGADLAILLGPLTQDGSAGGWLALQGALAALPVPAYVCPAGDDLSSGLFESYFGPALYGMRYGTDGFLFLGPGLAAEDPAVPGRLGDVHLIRRRLRASRWSTGVSVSYDPGWSVRGQIILFVDDPLDYLIAGAVRSVSGKTVPWGGARIVPPPEVPRGPVVIIDVTAGEMKLRQRPAGEE